MSLLIISYLLLPLFGQVIISPTSTTSTTETYATMEINIWENNIINCGKNVCNITCSHPTSCKSLTIDASASNVLSLTCSNTSACESLTINTSADTSTTILCSSTLSCKNAFINAGRSDTVSLTCYSPETTGSGKGPCQYMYLNVTTSSSVSVNCVSDNACLLSTINGEDITNSLNVTCSAYWACAHSNIHCPFRAKCNIQSISQTQHFAQSAYGYWLNAFIQDINADFNWACGTQAVSCQEGRIYCGSQETDAMSNLVYTDSKWICSPSTPACCPNIFGIQRIICTSGIPCQIDCDIVSCDKRHIDATLATSLSLNCGIGNEGCSGALIECPINDYTFCNIYCLSRNSCKFSTVHASASTNSQFTLDCGAYGSCGNMDVILNSTEITNFNVHCTTSSACSSLQLFSTSTSLIHSLDLVCIGSSACAYTKFEFNIANNASIQCGTAFACLQAQFTLTSTTSDANIDIHCVNPSISSAINDGACYQTLFEIYGYQNNENIPNNVSYICGENDNDCSDIKLNGLDFSIFTPSCIDSGFCSEVKVYGNTINQPNSYCVDSYSCLMAHIYCCLAPSTSTLSTSISNTILTSVDAQSQSSTTSMLSTLTSSLSTLTTSLSTSMLSTLSTSLSTSITATVYILFNENNDSSTNSNQTVIGIAVGSSFVIVLCILLIWILYWYKKSKTETKLSASISLVKSTVPVVIDNNCTTSVTDTNQNETLPPGDGNKMKYYSNKSETKLGKRVMQVLPIQTNTELLPNGWCSLVDVDGRIYYQNNITKQTQWEKPIEISAATAISIEEFEVPGVVQNDDLLLAPSAPSSMVEMNEIISVEGSNPNEIETGANDDKYKEIKDFFADLMILDDCKAQYYELFVSNGFDTLAILKSVTHQDLIDIGIHKLGHRKIIILNTQQL